MIGSSDEQPGHTPSEAPRHRVQLDPYYIGRREVTNAEYARYLDDTGVSPPPHWSTGHEPAPDEPVTGLTWSEAQAWVEWAGLRLPSEAQWEHAARAGSSTAYAFGDAVERLTDYAVCAVEGSHPRAVAMRQPNAWGIYDAHGNVWEWVADRFGAYTRSTRPGDGVRDGAGAQLRVIRGGSWANPARMCRSASRSAMDPAVRDDKLGFRAAAPRPLR